jgi:hypothetical protein
MTIKNMPLYLCVVTEEWQKKIVKKGSVAKHKFGEINNRTIIWPEKIDSETINPKNVNEIKKQFNLKELVFIDRLIGTNKPVSIINHVNRSGQNFLRSNTPFEEYPQFPDMSKIYNKISGLDAVVVHTIGEKRFQSPPSEEKTIWSETIGLIAPVAHYVGIKVFAIGGRDAQNALKYL